MTWLIEWAEAVIAHPSVARPDEWYEAMVVLMAERAPA